MIIDDLGDYLQTNTIGVVGTSIFKGNMPPRLNNILMLVSSPSPRPDTSIEYFIQYIDIWSRYASQELGIAKLKAIQDLLHQRANYTLGDYHVFLSSALGEIQDLDRDSENRKLQKISFEFVYKNVS